MRAALLRLMILAAVASACAPGPGSRGPVQPAQPGLPSRPLSILVGREPFSLSLRALGQAGSTIATSRRLFSATLVLIDASGASLPYLAESLPRLHTDSWQVAPDGRMETTYVLRPNLTWHDGAQLTADDFAFAGRLFSEPQLGQTSSAPFNSIEEVVAPDPRTVLIRWKRPFPLAGSLAAEIPPVPRHVLQGAFDQLQAGTMAPDALIRQPYWTTEFLGAGPYKLERWEAGISLEAMAFDQHVLGRPKIERITVGFSSDANASLARMLGGYVDYASDTAIGSRQALTLKDDWAAGKGGGAILLKLDYYRGVYAQLRPEQATPAAIMDLRARRALAYGIDKQALHDGLDGFEGGNVDADAPFIVPTTPYYARVDRAITRFPYDPRLVTQLMGEAGLTRGADGFFQSATEGRLRWEVKTSASADNEAEISILANAWRQQGFDFQQAVLPASLAQDGQARITFPTLYSFGTGVGENFLAGMNTAGIPRPENRFTGNNRSAWSNSEFDRLTEALSRALEPDQRAELIAQMTGVLSPEAVAIPLYFYGYPAAATSALVGPVPVVQEATFEWNIHEWQLTR